jgi:hypothetical protein
MLIFRIGPILAVGLAGLAWVAFAAGAQAGEPYHVRGTLAAIDGKTLTVDTREGGTKTIVLNEGAGMFLVDGADIADIKAGQFVGITSVMKGEVRTAIEVHIFAPDLYGLAEGHYAWDLIDEPNMMTNAAVGWIDDVDGGRKLRARYTNPDKSDGAQTITVSGDATIVTLDVTTAEAFVPGRGVWVMAIDNEDGSTGSPAVAIGTAAVDPPF